MPRTDYEAESDTLRLALEQIEAGQIVIRRGADEAIAELRQRLRGGPVDPLAADPGSEACAG